MDMEKEQLREGISDDMLSFVKRQPMRSRKRYLNKMSAYLQTHCGTRNIGTKKNKIKKLLETEALVTLTRPKLSLPCHLRGEGSHQQDQAGPSYERAQPAARPRRPRTSRRRGASGDLTGGADKQCVERGMAGSTEQTAPHKTRPQLADSKDCGCKSKRLRKRRKKSGCCCANKSSRRRRGSSRCRKKRKRGACRKRSKIECCIL